ncbi:MAG: hypothetical protein JKX73_02285 [Flavobacteriales bacterium]|nr:hypothetical protein [Flavobacteriales bacterium]
MNRTILLLILLFPAMAFSPALAGGQEQAIIDSLSQIIDNPASHDTAICRAYLIWGAVVFRNNPDTGLVLWRKAHGIAGKHIVADQPTVEPEKLHKEEITYSIQSFFLGS